MFVAVVLVVEVFFPNRKYLEKSKSNQTITVSQTGAQQSQIYNSKNRYFEFLLVLLTDLASVVFSR